MKEEYKTCPNCHNMVDKKDKQCPYCLTPLTRRNSSWFYWRTEEYNLETENTEYTEDYDINTENESTNNETIRNDKPNTTSEGLLPLLRSLVKKKKWNDETMIIKAIIIICIFIMLGSVYFAYTFLK